jgi:hypothetical protein
LSHLSNLERVLDAAAERWFTLAWRRGPKR